MELENREDLRSILPLVPLKLEFGSLVWPNQVIEALKALSRGSTHSRVDSGEVLVVAINDIRTSLSLSAPILSPSVGEGYALFFDEFLSRAEAAKWFGEVIPEMANLLLRLPSLLTSHYQKSSTLLDRVETSLRLLEAQQPGIVILSQELIAALLSCSFFCLFPTTKRENKRLPMINFDKLFATLYECYNENLEHKMKCIIHYFGRVCACMPQGLVSYERKVLTLERNACTPAYPDANFWAKSLLNLCSFEVSRSGLIEDYLGGAIQVDFANKYLGGGALHRGCVQEEIRFMINPELIVGMLFLPSMSDNEAIEVIGAERFSNYSGYSSKFRFSGDFMDKSEVDSIGRRKTRIVAIDALCCPGWRQYELDLLLREVNKAFGGFLDQYNYQHCQRLASDAIYPAQLLKDGRGVEDLSGDQPMYEASVSSIEDNWNDSVKQHTSRSQEGKNTIWDDYKDAGVITGNWGCGAFGGDPELKSMLQWIAASQASRPFISYYTFELAALENLEQVTQWIQFHRWTVGDLWSMVSEYSSRRIKGETTLGFFSWLLPLGVGRGLRQERTSCCCTT